MTNAKKIFRVETMFGSQDNAAAAPNPETHEILREIKSLRALIVDRQDKSEEKPDPQSEIASAANELARLRDEMHEAQKLKVELDAMYHAISETKREIASLHMSSFAGDNLNRVTDELDEVVIGTESATERILSAVENIDEDATNLAARLSGTEHDAVADIQEQVVKIYEACNFQDLTGQRITKVVKALRFVEERVEKMMEIWGGINSFQGMETAPEAAANDDDALLNGPSSPGDIDVATQDDIDALFA